MRKIKVSEASTDALDWLVAKCEGVVLDHGLTDDERYSTNWAQCGPIIEREEIYVRPTGDASRWEAYTWGKYDTDLEGFINEQFGPTPLIAAMRCYVTSELGEEVEVPDELL